jgi:hypothetical protein
MSQDNTLRQETPTPPEPKPEPGQLVRPAHGRGLLRNGSKPGNPAGPGVPPSVVRERARRSFYDRINTLEQLADGEEAARDRIRAIDTLGRYGLMTGRLDLEEVRARLHRTVAKIEELCDPDTAARILSAIDPIWNPKKG